MGALTGFVGDLVVARMRSELPARECSSALRRGLRGCRGSYSGGHVRHFFCGTSAGLALVTARPVIGVLALQGDVREHAAMLVACGAEPRAVRRPEELTGLAGIVIPGGESTTIDKLSRIFELRDPLVAAIRAGLPAYGSCAGMIMLADRLADAPPDQQTFGGLNVTVRRNAFGRQTESFEADLTGGWPAAGRRASLSGQSSSGRLKWWSTDPRSRCWPRCRWPTAPSTSSPCAKAVCSQQLFIPRSPATSGSMAISWSWPAMWRPLDRGC